ncbi:anti-sigma factor family protein [Altericroceibacterium xinjiangense]|uniref:anti-sigma factor family protein n=1 Tax=Altericroceibacterium xinjiangense TaxID=762261 RepID=UPI000F7D911B|nr:hypothetical protein [Altericroceibacterium xinjiangense]
MKVSAEELAAYADGQLEPRRQAEIARSVAADPALAAEVRSHRALKAKLSSHFAPILSPSTPEAKPARPGDRVRKPATPKDARPHRKPGNRPLWPWILIAAVAGFLVALLFFPRGEAEPPPVGGTYLEAPVAQALDEQLVATQPAEATTRILISFRNADGEYCRVFSGAQEGIACRDSQGWRLIYPGEGGVSGGASDLLTRAQEMASSPAFDAAEEQDALDSDWR